MSYQAVPLPATGEEMFALADEMRRQEDANKAKRVSWWLQLKDRGGKYWESVGCHSDHELLARLDFVYGAELAEFEVIVCAVDAKTVEIVGFDLLRETMRILDMARKKDQPKRSLAEDLKAVLAVAGPVNGDFDRQAFREAVNKYGRNEYPVGAAAVSGTSRK